MEQLLAPSRQTEVTVLAASTTPTLGTIFPAYPLDLGSDPRLFSSGLVLRADTELRV